MSIWMNVWMNVWITKCLNDSEWKKKCTNKRMKEWMIDCTKKWLATSESMEERMGEKLGNIYIDECEWNTNCRGEWMHARMNAWTIPCVNECKGNWRHKWLNEFMKGGMTDEKINDNERIYPYYQHSLVSTLAIRFAHLELQNLWQTDRQWSTLIIIFSSDTRFVVCQARVFYIIAERIDDAVAARTPLPKLFNMFVLFPYIDLYWP